MALFASDLIKSGQVRGDWVIFVVFEGSGKAETRLQT